MNKEQYKAHLRQRLHEQNADSINKDKDPLDPAMRWVATHPYLFMGGAVGIGAAGTVVNHLINKDLATPYDPPSKPPSKRPPQSQWDPEVSAAWDRIEGLPPKRVDASQQPTSRLHSDPRYAGDAAYRIQSAKENPTWRFSSYIPRDSRVPDVTPPHVPDVTPPHVTAPKVKVKGAGVVGLITAPLIAATTALVDNKSFADAGRDAVEAAVNNLDPLVTTTLGSNDVPYDSTPEEQKKDMDAANAQREKQDNDEAEKTKQNALNDTKSGNNSLNKTITDILSGAAKKNI